MGSSPNLNWWVYQISGFHQEVQGFVAVAFRVVVVPQDGTIGRSCVVRFVVSISDEYLGF